MQSPEALHFFDEAQMEARFQQPAPGHRDWYAYEALRSIPRIILMIDKNRFSKTYGCFDREFWHYRTVDFPCAMNQEFCLPLAMAYSTPIPNNPYYKVERLKELVVASIEFARKHTHSDGSCDDYFPFEKALGALVFSTYAMTESYMELELNRPDFIDFFRLRADWLLNNNETGRLANHQAFAALALYNVYLLTHDVRYLDGSNHYRDLTLSWQNEEGWYQEYEGADPGYHSCSIAFLSKLYQKSKDETLLGSLEKAVEFATYFMHPDGSYAGEYGSRNTYHFYPHGFEVMSQFFPKAGQVADTYLYRSLPERRRYFNDDNRMCAHYVYDWIQSWRDYNPERTGTLEQNRGPFERYFEDARLFVKKTDSYYAVLSVAKGGVLKVFDESGPLYSDAGLLARTKNGDVLVSHLVDHNDVSVDLSKLEFETSGRLSRRRYPLPSPVKQILFRGMNLTVGRFGAHVVRPILQAILITGKPRTDVGFTRKFVFGDDSIEITNTVDNRKASLTFRELAVGSDSTSIYVANSNTFQESVLLPWQDLSHHVAELNHDRIVEFHKQLRFEAPTSQSDEENEAPTESTTAVEEKTEEVVNTPAESEHNEAEPVEETEEKEEMEVETNIETNGVSTSEA
jgi:hypothetical protein